MSGVKSGVLCHSSSVGSKSRQQTRTIKF